MSLEPKTPKPDNLWHATCVERFSSPPLSNDIVVDIVIVGGGYTGCAAALHAAQTGAKVCLLEAKEIGHGGSGRNVGLVNAGLWLPPETIAAQMGDAPAERLTSALCVAPDQVFSLIDTHAIKCEAVRAGTLHCAHSPAGMKNLKDRHRQQAALGAPVTLLNAKEAQSRTGTSTIHGALHDARAGTVQPFAYCQGLARAAATAGAVIHEQTPVQSIRSNSTSWQVTTPMATVRAGAMILATNAYHLGMEGLSAPESVPVHYLQFATAPLPDDVRRNILPGGEGCWDTALVMSSFRLDKAGRLIIGGVGDLGHAASGVHRKWARRKLRRFFPQAADVPLEYAWDGRIAMTSDHIPKIVRLGHNAYSIFGYSGRGIGPGTVFGTALANVLLGQSENNLPIQPCDNHTEPFAQVRQVYFETGATLAHAISGHGRLIPKGTDTLAKSSKK